MRRNINSVFSSAVVTALAIAPRVNVDAVVIVAAGILLSLIYLRLANFRKLMAEPPIDNY